MVEHVIGRNQRQAGRFAKRSKTGEAPCIVTAIEVMRGKISAVSKIRRDAGREIRHICRLRRQSNDNLTIAVCDHISVVEMTFALGGAALAESQ